ncbi:MAG: FUSC family protein [Janthinobacterium lividum]
MTNPTLRDWLFSVRTFAAAMLALYLALRLDLPRPYWAMASVYVVSNPFLGATRSKALYRALGTVIGAVAAIALVPPLAEMPLVLSLVISVWAGVLLYISLFDRSARSYVFMLSAYSLPLIALPAVSDPLTVFDIAVARTEEILLGIVCASVVASIAFPVRLAPMLAERTLAWFGDAALYMSEALAMRPQGPVVVAARQRLIITINGLELLISQLAYDGQSAVLIRSARELRGRMALMLPLISSLADVLLTLRNRLGGTLPADFEALLGQVSAWVQKRDASSQARGAELRHALLALEPAASDEREWSEVLLSSAIWRLVDLVDLWEDCAWLQAAIARDRVLDNWTPAFRHWRLEGRARYYDRGMFLFSAALAALATFVASCLWIFMGWADGAGAVTLVAVACCFFAALDEPAPMLRSFFIWTSFSVVVSGLYLFAVLPNVHEFEMLILLFAAPFIIVGALIPQPRFALATMLVSVNTATFISVQSTYSADFFSFINGNVAALAGLTFALVWTLVTRPFGAELSVRRLVKASWEDLVATASPLIAVDERGVASRMLDRLMQLLPRLSVAEEGNRSVSDGFRDLRVGLNTLDLQQELARMSEGTRDATLHVLEGVAEHFRECLARRRRVSAPDTLRAQIDAAIGAASRSGAVSTPRAVLYALVGLRVSVFPESPLPASPVTVA